MADKKCTKPIQGHIDLLSFVLSEAGVDPTETCVQTYQALVEFAEFIRRLNGFEPYTTVLAEKLATDYTAFAVAAKDNNRPGMIAALKGRFPEKTDAEIGAAVDQAMLSRVNQAMEELRQLAQLAQAMAYQETSSPSKAIGAPMPRNPRRTQFDD